MIAAALAEIVAGRFPSPRKYRYVPGGRGSCGKRCEAAAIPANSDCKSFVSENSPKLRISADLHCCREFVMDIDAHKS